MTMVAALYVEKDGCYFGLPNVDPWDVGRDARAYDGPHPVVAHPPCQRWGRFWHGSTRKPHQFKLGEDDGCFAAALAAVRKWSGVLEHPADSHAWRHFGLNPPPREGGWIAADFEGGWTCCVYQGHYGHMAGKGTWLYAHGIKLPELRWGKCEQRLHPVALAKHGYEKARRIGMMADGRRQGQNADSEHDADRVQGRADFDGSARQEGRMTPAQLDALIHSQKKPGSHGDRNCPKCGTGYMGYYASMYSCTECRWIEYQHGPWTPVAKRKENATR